MWNDRCPTDISGHLKDVNDKWPADISRHKKMWNVELPLDISLKQRLPTRQIKTDKMTQQTNPLSLYDLSDRSRDHDLTRQTHPECLDYPRDSSSLQTILEWNPARPQRAKSNLFFTRMRKKSSECHPYLTHSIPSWSENSEVTLVVCMFNFFHNLFSSCDVYFFPIIFE